MKYTSLLFMSVHVQSFSRESQSESALLHYKGSTGIT